MRIFHNRFRRGATQLPWGGRRPERIEASVDLIDSRSTDESKAAAACSTFHTRETVPTRMTRPTPWFERRFELDARIEQLPNVCSRLRGAPARLDELLNAQRELLTRRPDPSHWSAQEHAGHLADLEPLWRARVQDFALGRSTLTAADLTNRATFDARHNDREPSSIVAAFRSARGQLLSDIDALESAVFERALVHPRLGRPMHLLDHLTFIAEHDDHHLATIWHLVHAARSP